MLKFWLSSFRNSLRVEVVLSRSRISHTYFTNHYLMTRNHKPISEYCNTDLIVKRILTDCSQSKILDIPYVLTVCLHYNDIFIVLNPKFRLKRCIKWFISKLNIYLISRHTWANPRPSYWTRTTNESLFLASWFYLSPRKTTLNLNNNNFIHLLLGLHSVYGYLIVERCWSGNFHCGAHVLVYFVKTPISNCCKVLLRNSARHRKSGRVAAVYRSLTLTLDLDKGRVGEELGRIKQSWVGRRP